MESKDVQSIIKKRQLILRYLSTTRDIEFPEDKGLCVRHYCLTQEEANAQKEYCFKVVFGTNTSKTEDKREGCCYDWRNLLNDKYIMLDTKESFLPIVVTPQRWKYLEEHKGDKLLKITNVYKPGILLWPLTPQEVENIAHFFKKQMIFFFDIHPEDTQFIEEQNFSWKKGTVFYYDPSADKRFAPKSLSSSIVSLDEIQLTEDETHDPAILDRIASVQKRIESDLKDLLPKEWWAKELESTKTTRMMQKFMKNNATDTQIYGVILNMFLRNYVEQKK